MPLFVEELTKTIMTSGWLSEREAHYELTGFLPTLAILTTLHDSLMATSRPPGHCQRVAQLAATLDGSSLRPAACCLTTGRGDLAA